MLVLKRSRGQCIRIGKLGEVTVKFLSYQNGTIRLGIEAPKEMPVDREEIHLKKLSLDPNITAANDAVIAPERSTVRECADVKAFDSQESLSC